MSVNVKIVVFIIDLRKITIYYSLIQNENAFIKFLWSVPDNVNYSGTV